MVFEISWFFNFQVAATAVLDFRNFQLLLAKGFWGAEMHHHAKFHQNLLIHCGDIAIVQFFKMAAVAILDF